MSQESFSQPQESSELPQVEGEVSQEEFMKIQYDVLSLTGIEESEMTKWFLVKANSLFVRHLIMDNLTTQAPLDLDELAEMVKSRVDETKTIH